MKLKKIVRLVLLALMLIVAAGGASFAAEPWVYIESPWTYTVDEVNNQVTIIGYAGNDSELVIPWSLGGIDVKSIASGAIKSASVKKIYVPDNGVSYPEDAFPAAASVVMWPVLPDNSEGDDPDDAGDTPPDIPEGTPEDSPEGETETPPVVVDPPLPKDELDKYVPIFHPEEADLDSPEEAEISLVDNDFAVMTEKKPPVNVKKSNESEKTDSAEAPAANAVSIPEINSELQTEVSDNIPDMSPSQSVAPNDEGSVKNGAVIAVAAAAGITTACFSLKALKRRRKHKH